MISLEVLEGMLTLQVEEIGVGISPEALGQPRSLGGYIEIAGIPRKEMTVVVRMPVVDQTMRILIVDDRAIFREGLKSILSAEFVAVAFGDASNATEAISAGLETEMGFFFLDITMR